MWIEYCEEAAAEGRMSYSHQSFCEMFSEEAERLGGVRAHPDCTIRIQLMICF